MHKDQKIIIWGLIILLAVIGLVWLAKPSSTGQETELPPVANISIAADETKYDFGNISMKDGNVSHKFKIKNTASEPLSLNKLYTSCMCTSASLLAGEKRVGPFGMPGHGSSPSFKETLEPGAEMEIEVTFDPNAHGPAGIGRIERIVYLESNGQTVLELGIAAFVKP
ncbi:MAG: DUF1573 domain-containing protein [Candidatus Yanofskybacteria bacterium]|nr:DUF1573 domain-containing protein [Candidatus Yanofskybacteria bacterium]